MNSAVLLLPCGSLYQIYEQRRLEHLYDGALNHARNDANLVDIPVNAVKELRANQSNFTGFYNACYFMDTFESSSIMMTVAKTITALVISLSCFQGGIAIGAGIGLAVAFEGLCQGFYACWNASKFRWHADPKPSAEGLLKLQFSDKIQWK